MPNKIPDGSTRKFRRTTDEVAARLSRLADPVTRVNVVAGATAAANDTRATEIEGRVIDGVLASRRESPGATPIGTSRAARGVRRLANVQECHLSAQGRCGTIVVAVRSPAVVVSPLRVVLTRDGIDLVLVSVEVWPDEIVLRMRGLPSNLTARLENGFHNALAAWSDKGRAGSPPQQPAERIFDFDVRVSDDVGTAYVPRSASRGGSGTMFRAEWTFTPGPPDAVESLTVQIAAAEAVRVDLIA
jgi:hypothetical protein